MQLVERRSTAFLNPLLNLVVATGLLTIVAFSIVMQPPDSGVAGMLNRAVAWLRALLFTGGAVGLLVAMCSYARILPSPASRQPDSDDVSGLMAQPELWRRSCDTEAPASYTLIALGDSDDDARAIIDFDDAGSLMTALRTWRWEHPDEHLLIFDVRGALIARRQAVPARKPATATARNPLARRALALGGAR